MPRYRMLVAVLAAVPLTLAAGCANNGNASSGNSPVASGAVAASAGGAIPLTPAPIAESLSETGSTLLFPLFRTWAAAYHQQHPQVTITTAATGSGAGIAGASSGAADLGASDAYLSSGDLVKNPALLNIPLAISAQQIYYNLPGLGTGTHLRLDAQVLAEMYQGQITRWNDPRIAGINPNVKLPTIPVVPLHRSDPTGSGDTFLFTSYLSAKDAFWSSHYGYGTLVQWPAIPGAVARRQALGLEGNPVVVSGCHATPGCVAYVGLSYAQMAASDGLGEAQLQNRAGNYELPSDTSIPAAAAPFVSSTPPNETISMIDGPAAGGYPIVNYEYAVVSTRQHSAAKARDLRAFLHWIITAGQSANYRDDFTKYLGEPAPLSASIPGFQPLPASVVALSDAQIARIR